MLFSILKVRARSLPEEYREGEEEGDHPQVSEKGRIDREAEIEAESKEEGRGAAWLWEFAAPLSQDCLMISPPIASFVSLDVSMASFAVSVVNGGTSSSPPGSLICERDRAWLRNGSMSCFEPAMDSTDGLLSRKKLDSGSLCLHSLAMSLGLPVQ